MKGFIFILIFGILISCSFISAWEFDNSLSPITIAKGDSYNFDGKAVTYNNLWEKYSPLEVKNAFGLGATLLEGYIDKNTEMCGSDCSSEFVVKMYEEGVLIENIRFKKLVGERWVDGNVIGYKTYIKTGEKEVEVNDYGYVCTPTGKINPINGTAEQSCVNKITGTHIEKEAIWEEYNLGDIKQAGTYTVKLEAQKKPSQTIDWQIETQGKWLESWATWDATTTISNQLTRYYDFESTTDLVGGDQNLVDNEGTGIVNASNCKIGSCNQVLDGNNFKMNPDANTNFNRTNFSINFWYRPLINLNDGGMLVAGGGAVQAFIGSNTNAWYLETPWGIGNGYGSVSAGTYYMITYTKNYTTRAFYVDSVLLKNTTSDSFRDFENTIKLGLEVYATDTSSLEGQMDELGLWNRSLTPTEIVSLYNSGNGLAYASMIPSTVSLNAPINYYNTSSLTTNFNCSASVVGATLVNISVWTNKSGTWQLDNFTTSNGANQSLSFTDGKYKWNCQACDSDGDCGWGSANRTISIDSNAPTVNITYPTGTFNGLTNGDNVSLNYSATDNNLDKCWVDYNGANTTLTSCKNTTFIYIFGTNVISIWANDSSGNTNNASVNFTPTIAVYNLTYNLESYDTTSETFNINATGMTAASLVYNGISYAATITGTIASSTLTATPAGNRSFYWNLNTGAYNTALRYQNVIVPKFSLCNSTYPYNYINFTFRDEVTTATLNGTLNPLTIQYSFGDLNSYNSFSFTNTTGNPSYGFCFSPESRSINTSIVAVVASSGYPIRYWRGVQLLNNNTLNQTINLLSSADGIYQSVVVATGNGIAIQGATVTASTIASGVVESRVTDTSGQVALWLNPDIAYVLTTSASGYDSDIRVINPSSTPISITLGAAAGFPSNMTITYTEGVTYSISPAGNELYNDSSYNFIFTVNHGTYDINSFWFNLYNSTGDIVSNASSSSNGGTLSKNYNVGKDSQITMVAQYNSNGTTNTINKVWSITSTDGAGYGLLNFGNRLKTYIGSGLFGLTTGFALNILCFLIIVITTGIISFKYGFDNPIIIGGIAVLLTGIFELGLGLIDVGTYIPITGWGVIGLLILIIREGFR